MQYGAPVSASGCQEKCNSSLEVVTFPWINFSGYNFNIMNTLHQFAANIFQITISRLPVKPNKIYIDVYINDA